MHRALGSKSDTSAPAADEGLSADGFANCFEEAARPLWCIAAAVVGDRTLAEDVVQEAALIGLRKRSDFAPGTSFGAWMGQIVRNVARNSLRQRVRQARQTNGGAPLEALPAERVAHSSGVSPRGELLVDQSNFDDEVVRALGELTETARTCLLLRTVLELSYQEMAELLGIPQGTAMSHVHRARQEMRRALSNAAGPEGTV
ncbi:MAG: RNA polymerase sigma factor [Planctomycetota bacterium]|jgi:RNA polymerase sigma-70 factor (ECF subfamily)